MTWSSSDLHVVHLPSGRKIRARALRRLPPVGPVPNFGLYLLARQPSQAPWPSRWVRWRDFRVPANEADACEALVEAWRRASTERVEVACGGGRGRTGTALACLAVLDGIPPTAAVAWVRRNYDPKAVETPWQRRWVFRFANAGPTNR
ncbi:protein-tyrosine phosphatase family protein [Aquipuribacter hungaricus]|uniref:Protein phosphatase n=1 Tax=Aquipuribacter hungaricus TaxID=545624 RepID=A0ABV7WAW5_9MICO